MPKPLIVYVLHKQGANAHYSGLDYLISEQGGRVLYREFSVLGRFFRGLVKGNWAQMAKQLVNMAFLIRLFFTRNKKIVLGIAPFDRKLGSLLRLLRKHQVYYHNSWTVWDGSHHPKNKGVTPKVLLRWKRFLEQDAKHIFAVTTETKIQLMANYTLPEHKISVVYHSCDSSVFNADGAVPRTGTSFVYAGRLLPEKGLEPLLDYFSVNPRKRFTLFGKGNLKCLVEKYVQKFPNIKYDGYSDRPEKLAQEFREHDYVLLNSVKTTNWQEVFGMVLIEAMACGAVPIATYHAGPCEIIKNGHNGYLVQEGAMPAFLETMPCNNYAALQHEALKTAAQFNRQAIARRWAAILG